MPNKLLRIAIVWVSSWLAITADQVLAVEADSRPVRLALVNIPDDIVRPLLPEFQASSGMKAEIVYTGNDPFGFARAGKADLVISHYGHAGVQPFVTEGLGAWPHTVFANQVALLGPADDPAQVKGMTDASAALAKIAAVKAPFMVNGSGGTRYLEEILWHSAGITPKGSWYKDAGEQGRGAVEAASRLGAYVLWGLPPFMRNRQSMGLELEPLVVGDPAFARIMVSIVVNPQKLEVANRVGANPAGAQAFEAFLVAPQTQARIRAFRYPGLSQQVWWPAGRHNNAKE